MRTFNLFLHLIAAISWIGGMVFVTVVVTPYARTLDPAVRGDIFREVGTRFRTLGWVSIAVLISTGFGNMHFMGLGLSDLAETRFGNILLIKLFLVLLMLINSVLHDFVFGPRMTMLQRAGVRPSPMLSWAASWMARLNLLFALIVVWLGTLFTR